MTKGRLVLTCQTGPITTAQTLHSDHRRCIVGHQHSARDGARILYSKVDAPPLKGLTKHNQGGELRILLIILAVRFMDS